MHSSARPQRAWAQVDHQQVPLQAFTQPIIWLDSLCGRENGEIKESELVHLKWEVSPGIQSTQWHLDLEEAHTGKKNKYFYNWIMDTTLDMSLERSNRSSARKQSYWGFSKRVSYFLSRDDAVSEAHTEQQIREQCCSRSTHATTLYDWLLAVPWGEKVIWDSSCCWGWVQILPKSVIIAYLPFISLLDVGAKGGLLEPPDSN